MQMSHGHDGMDEAVVKIRLGVCAMAKKAASKPMREILARITSFSEFETIFFDETVGEIIHPFMLSKKTDEPALSLPARYITS